MDNLRNFFTFDPAFLVVLGRRVCPAWHCLAGRSSRCGPTWNLSFLVALRTGKKTNGETRLTDPARHKPRRATKEEMQACLWLTPFPAGLSPRGGVPRASRLGASAAARPGLPACGASAGSGSALVCSRALFTRGPSCPAAGPSHPPSSEDPALGPQCLCRSAALGVGPRGWSCWVSGHSHQLGPVQKGLRFPMERAWPAFHWQQGVWPASSGLLPGTSERGFQSLVSSQGPGVGTRMGPAPRSCSGRVHAP